METCDEVWLLGEKWRSGQRVDPKMNNNMQKKKNKQKIIQIKSLHRQKKLLTT